MSKSVKHESSDPKPDFAVIFVWLKAVDCIALRCQFATSWGVARLIEPLSWNTAISYDSKSLNTSFQIYASVSVHFLNPLSMCIHTLCAS